MLEFQNITKIYKSKGKEVVGVDNVSLKINKGDVFGIVGYSGAGKSSLLRCVNLLERPTSGKVLVNGIDLTRLKGKDLRTSRLKIGMIFQHFYLISQKTVGENIAFALRAANTPSQQLKARVDELLEMVGLTDKRDVYPGQLSGGQKQRVGIARALANNPSILLCDEATSALDPKTTLSILRLLKDINKKLGITIILITHEMDVVKEICNRMAVMQDGRVIEEGEVYDIFAGAKEPLTQEFISSVVSFEIPEAILKDVRGDIIKILFKGSVAGEGVIADTMQKFNVKGNFLHGTIEYIQDRPLGIFLMELQGDSKAVSDAKQYMEERGAIVEVIPNVDFAHFVEMLPDIGKAFQETLIMLGISISVPIIIGLPLGILLFVTDKGMFWQNWFFNNVFGFIANLIRSIPFIILLVALFPLTDLIVGKTIGPVAASVSLTVAAIPFFARLVEGALRDIDKGVIEATIAVGATPWMIIKDVLIPEAKSTIIRGVTLTVISLVAYSAMAGVVGGGGIGDLAIRFGYYRYDDTIMIATVAILIIIVQLIQFIGEFIAKSVDKR